METQQSNECKCQLYCVIQEVELAFKMFFTSDLIRVIIGLQVLRELSVRVRCWAAS